MGSISATPLAKQIAKQKGISLGKVSPGNGRTYIIARDVRALSTVRSTPAARCLAKQLGISLSDIPHDGPRIYKKHVLSVKQNVSTSAEVHRLPGIKRITAQRMLQSHLEIPPVTLNAKADVTGLLAERDRVNSRGGVKLSINDYVVYAVACALKDNPDAYSSYSEEGQILNPDINIGIATAIKNGLIVPVVKNADRLSLQELSAAIKNLVSRARTGKLLTEEYAGGTFTVSNLGMYGITSFNPIINQPESMILGVCAVEQVLRMSPRGIEARDMMGLSLTFDHRLHDGAQAAAFLQSISKKLEKYNEEEK